MKMKKVFSACALLLALTVAGCNNGKSSAADTTSNKPASSQQSTNKPSTSATPAPSTSAAPSTSTPAPQPLGPALKTWTAEEVKAGMSNASAKEVKDETGDVQFTVYKLGTANDTLTLEWTPTAEQAGKVVFKLFFTTKAGNAASATFWKQSATSQNDKMSISVDGQAVAAPEAELAYTFEDICGGTDGVVESDVEDNGALANPVEYKMAEYNVTAGAKNTIVVTYLGGGYSFYIAGATVYKAA